MSDHRAVLSQRSCWIAATLLWIAVIFFSSTSLAGRSCEHLFGFLVATYFKSLRPHIGFYQPLHLVAEKSVHVCLFLVLAALLAKALPNQLRKFGLILSIGLVIGSCSEYLQSFFPGRDPALRDVCLNAAATALGAAIVLGLKRNRLQPELPN